MRSRVSTILSINRKSILRAHFHKSSIILQAPATAYQKPKPQPPATTMHASKYLFFWGHANEKKGVFSQWFSLGFSATKADLEYLVTASNKDILANLPEKIDFANGEQYMMFSKALFFNDAASVSKVLDTTDPKAVKALGRGVQNYVDAEWAKIREQVGIEGNFLKFSQTEWAKERLLETDDQIIVEASPRDKIWGIGFGQDNAMKNYHRWGLNILGKSLMEARERIQTKQGEATASSSTKST